jgi:hypothetical protein
MQTKELVYSWIGSPFGPDCLGGELKINYQYNKKWSCEFDYLFTAHGENGFNLFNKKSDEGWYIYYPSVEYKLAKKGKAGYTEEDIQAIYAKANDMSLTGSVTYLNQFFLKGSYCFNSKMSLYSQLLYEFLISKSYNKIQHGFECGLSFKYKFI